jgi:hypothetical protein
MVMPNFLIIGAGKCGTSSLYAYLKQHPEIYMSPVKEPNFFAHDAGRLNQNGPARRKMFIAKSLDEYLKLYENVSNHKAIGEASPSNWGTYETIHQYMPEGRFIAILRQPVDRGYAKFLHRRRDGYEPVSDFLTAYKESESRRAQNWAGAFCYRDTYVATVEKWLSLFSSNQIRFYLTDDLRTDPLPMLQDIFRFLEVEDEFVPDTSERHNKGYAVRSSPVERLIKTHGGPGSIGKATRKFLPIGVRRRLFTRLANWNHVPIQPLDPDLRRQLTSDIAADILKLQNLIGRDLSHWLK